MGEPKKGQIPDNIFLSVQQVKMAGDEVIAAGDLMVRSSTPAEGWKKAGAADDAVDLSARGLVQARTPIDTTGLADLAVSTEVLSAPSYIYATAQGVIRAGSLVRLHTDCQKLIAAVAADLAAGEVIGRFSRLASDSAGNNDAATDDIIIVKLGVT